jgi:hypothetical protein
MTHKEHDQKCNALFRELDTMKAQGLDSERGGAYDAKLRELQAATRARLGA